MTLSTDLIPERGLKRDSLCEYYIPSPAFHRPNPRKGTETFLTNCELTQNESLSTDLIPERGLKRKRGTEAATKASKKLSTDLIPERGLKPLITVSMEVPDTNFPPT